MVPVVEVRVVCPGCGSARYRSDGRTGDVIYRACQECGYRGKVVRVLSSRVERVVMK